MLVDNVIAKGETQTCTHTHTQREPKTHIEFLLIFGVIFTFFEIVNFNNAVLHCSSFMHTSLSLSLLLLRCLSVCFLNSPLLFSFFSLKYLFNAFIEAHTDARYRLLFVPALFAQKMGCGVRS